MAILVDEDTRVLVQGATGASGRRAIRLMKACGTRVVAGVTPGRGGEAVEGVPVYDTVREAVDRQGPISCSLVSVPAQGVEEAVAEAVDAGIPLVVVRSERVPQHDVLRLLEGARERGVRILGPNTIGIMSPGRCLVGTLGGGEEFVGQVFARGPVGVVSRSGGQATTLAYYVRRAGMGQSTVVSVGGDAVVGMGWREILELFQADPETAAVVAFGEAGGTMELEAAELLASGRVTKPLVVYVAGRYVAEETRFGHAGAVVEGERGRAEYKRQALREAGAWVLDHLDEVGEVLGRLIPRGGEAGGDEPAEQRDAADGR
ncbi:MAG: CoA-binding protein [Armatimonadota bacterium]|nr:CoA-binding protein [Armatimonadota bacterium]